MPLPQQQQRAFGIREGMSPAGPENVDTGMALCERARMMQSGINSADSSGFQDGMIVRLRDRVRSRLGKHLRRIILFGSRARGDAHPDSDYDLLVVVDEVNSNVKDTIDEIAGEMLYEFGIVVSAFPTSEESVQAHPYSPLLMNIAREGVPV